DDLGLASLDQLPPLDRVDGPDGPGSGAAAALAALDADAGLLDEPQASLPLDAETEAAVQADAVVPDPAPAAPAGLATRAPSTAPQPTGTPAVMVTARPVNEPQA
ncbi:MAG TPA: hypothetical protein PLZ50_10035, partial [Rubrivivax sp.]|nr:hypothetical protein [Rubrivivax sp.]